MRKSKFPMVCCKCAVLKRVSAGVYESNSIQPLEAASAAWQLNIAAIFATLVLCYHVWQRQVDAIVKASCCHARTYPAPDGCLVNVHLLGLVIVASFSSVTMM